MSRHFLWIALLLSTLTSISLAQQPEVVWPAVSIAAPGTASTGWNYITEKPVTIASSTPFGIALGSDGAIWFVESSINSPGKIGRLTAAGILTEYPPGCCIGPVAITAGPDGALWFSDFFGGQIGRITTDGVINQYSILPLGTCCANPSAITAGPDGALWFVDNYGPKIGRITTAGVITEFPATFSNPYAITGGPDGALWFTEPSNNRIGRMTTTGRITEFPLTSAGLPQSIVAGPDGALWFTENGTGKIGRITVKGAITEYQLSSPISGPDGITVGPDKAIWFTESNANKVGRITRAGIITEYAVPTTATNPTGIAPGSDGGLWFSQSATNSIGRAWACGLGLSLAFSNGTLDISYDLGVASPADFVTALSAATGIKQLWSKKISAIVPPAEFTVPWGPGFPSIGNVVVYSSLSVPPTGVVCYESQNVNTGGTGATVEQLQHSIEAAGLMPNRP